MSTDTTATSASQVTEKAGTGVKCDSKGFPKPMLTPFLNYLARVRFSSPMLVAGASVSQVETTVSTESLMEKSEAM